jgi:hypothetical protein
MQQLLNPEPIHLLEHLRKNIRAVPNHEQRTLADVAGGTSAALECSDCHFCES